MANCIQCGRKLPAFTFGKRICQWCVQHEFAQRGEIDEDAKQHVMPAPWVRRETAVTLTKVFFGINVLVFLAMALAGVSILNPTSADLIRCGANARQLTLTGQWWRLLTSVFVHIGIIHIAFNMWCLWDLGALCESLYGSWTFGAVYLLSGIGASIASIAWRPYGVSAGASGAIFGIAGALIASFYLGEFSLPRMAIRGTLRSVVVFAAYNLVFGALSGITDNAAHVGGLVTGLILGALIARVAPEHDNVAGRIGVVLFGTLLVCGAGYGVWYWHGPAASLERAEQLIGEHQPDQAIAQLQQFIRRRPTYVPAHLTLAHAYFNQAQYPQAESELKRVLELQPQHLGARLELGMTYLNEKRASEAQECFARVLVQDPSDADAHFGMGMALAAQDNHSRAIEEFKTGIRLDPDSDYAYYSLGNSYSKLKMYDEAIAAYLKQREKEDDADTEDALAQAFEAKGMTDQAQEARNKAEQMKNAH